MSWRTSLNKTLKGNNCSLSHSHSLAQSLNTFYSVKVLVSFNSTLPNTEIVKEILHM